VVDEDPKARSALKQGEVVTPIWDGTVDEDPKARSALKLFYRLVEQALQS